MWNESNGIESLKEWIRITIVLFCDKNEAVDSYFEEWVGIYGWEEEDIVIDYAMFVKFAELAYSIYSENYGRDEEIEKDIESMHEKYHV